MTASLVWNLDNIRQQIMEQAYAEARANLNKDITFRRWGTTHGGVYVPVTDEQQPIPWMAHIPGRDVTTTDGKQLTLLNPASMLRQMMDAYAKEYGIRGRITGLRYLNPGNKPDEWETEQLLAFEKGEKEEVWSIAEINQQPHLRYLRAMFMETGCEKCHSILGYKLGDLRGATGLNLPLTDYYAQISEAQHHLVLSHGAFWILGLLGIGWGGRISRERQLEHEKRVSEKAEATESLRIYANAFENSGEAILITGADRRISNVNAAFSTLTGYSQAESIGKNPRFLTSDKTPQQTYQEMWSNLGKNDFWQGELWDKAKSGEIFPIWAAVSVIRDETGQICHYIASYTDISERKSAEARINHLAHHDMLTGLLNRFSLQNRLQQAIFSARRDKQQVAIFFIDLDRFKSVNDTLGHNIGDELLKLVAERLSACVRESDIVARIGGDEFVVVLTGLNDDSRVISYAEKMLKRLAATYHINGNELVSSPSIGISVFPNDGADESELIKNADVAMYHAKEQGRNNFQFFSENLLIIAQERLALENELHSAISGKQFELHYQPLIGAANKRICGLEALIRWHHPEKGLIPPDKFIPVAEDTGIINELGDWVIEEACRQLSEWKKLGFRDIYVAINLSVKQLLSDNLSRQLHTIMEKYQLASNDLEFEITETAAMHDPELAVDRLQALRQLGVTLVIDDLGTGYSSLAYLKRLPIQILKLDRTFVSEIESNSNDTEICMATLALAHNIGLKVVAEGVETLQQRDFLLKHQCDFLQGYLFSAPLPAAQATDFIRSNLFGNTSEFPA
ncbi:MAG: EAL domain-containing protein [Chromatiales bacterium]